MRYKSRIDKIFYLSVILMLLMLVGLPIIVFFDDEGGILPSAIMFVIISLVCAFIFTLPKTTHYTFEENALVCRSSFLKRTIPYSEIRRIEYHKGLYAGWKFSLASRGIVIAYRKHSELFITPQDQDKFVQDLLDRNSEIEIKK